MADQTLPAYALLPLSEHDREEVIRFAEFLAAVGRPPFDPERTDFDRAALLAWIEAAPEERCAYLGLSRDQARKLGYAIP